MSNSYNDDVQAWKSAYQEILEVCQKHSALSERFHNFDDVKDMERSAQDHLMLIEWYEKYGLKIDHNHKPHSYKYLSLSNFMRFNFYDDAAKDKQERSGRYISCSDDDRQPHNEWLLGISFPTGAYIFGRDYDGQQQLFKDFFQELKSYSPDYADTINKNLYWKLENAKPIYEGFQAILEKYHERNKAELSQRKIESLRKELSELEDSKQ